MVNGSLRVDIINIRKVYPQSDDAVTNEAGGSKRRMVDVLLRLLNNKNTYSRNTAQTRAQTKVENKFNFSNIFS